MLLQARLPTLSLSDLLVILEITLQTVSLEDFITNLIFCVRHSLGPVAVL